MLLRKTAMIWIVRKGKLASAQIVFAAQFVLLNASALWLSEIQTKRWLKSLGLGTPTTGLHNIFKTFIQTFTIFRKAVAEYAFNSENNEGGEDSEDESESNEDETDNESNEDETAEENLENYLFNLT